MIKLQTPMGDLSIPIALLKDGQTAVITKYANGCMYNGHIIMRMGKHLINITSCDWWSDAYSIGTFNRDNDNINYRCEVLPNGTTLVVSQPEA